jgi:hypothetical protein
LAISRLTDPALDLTLPAPLGAQAFDTLLATTEPFLGYPVETAHAARHIVDRVL